MIKFMVDTQLPPTLTIGLVKHGYMATHPAYLPAGAAMTDRQIREYAIAEDCIIITKDRDFFDYFMVKGAPPRVLLLQFGNIKNKDLSLQFDAHFEQISREFERGAQLILFGPHHISIY